MRKPISVEKKLAVTLRYLVTGESFSSLMYQYQIHSSTIVQFVAPICQDINNVLAPGYMSVPNNEQEWMTGTYETCQYPICLAGADGKQVGIVCPAYSGSEFYNCKDFFSIVLLAFIDYDFRLIATEVGCQGHISNGGYLQNLRI